MAKIEAAVLCLVLCISASSAYDQVQKGGGILRRPLPFAGNGTCDPPVRSENGHTTVRCLGPVIPMLPGQTIDAYISLESPYPTDRNVTVVHQEAQLVAKTGPSSWREVPLSELYLHHVVPNPRFLFGAGAEVRGSRLRKPMREPYAFIVDGKDAASYEARHTNLQLVNLVGVPPKYLQQSFECWCGHPQLGEESVKGSLFCCKQNPTNSSAGVGEYQLEYNVTFRDVRDSDRGINTFGFDATGNSLEYNIFPLGPDTLHTIATEAVIDQDCPQPKPFEIIRCTAHQHIGSKCMNAYNLDKDNELICSSCPIYGNVTDEPGNERGFVVAIQDDDVSYTIEPGTRIRIESVYDGSQKRLGVMALWAMWVGNLTRDCGARSAMSHMNMLASAYSGEGVSAA